jgi:hypothetical protein
MDVLLWFIANKEIISMITNIAVTLGVLLSAFVIIWNVRSLKLQKSSFQADLFNKISSELNVIIDQQKNVENKGEEFIENWYERLLGKFEYFAFFANRKLLSKDMIDYYIPAINTYLDCAMTYPDLKKELTSRKKGEYNELEKYYEKYSGKKLPF